MTETSDAKKLATVDAAEPENLTNSAAHRPEDWNAVRISQLRRGDGCTAVCDRVSSLATVVEEPSKMGKLVRRPAPVIHDGGPGPVKVRLQRMNCNRARPHPPDGQSREWWQRLKDALGTASSAFVDASLIQLIAAARLPGSGISEIAVNAALAFIESARPQDEVECALVVQMACTHATAMGLLSRIGGGHGGDRSVASNASAVTKLLRAYTMQMAALRRLRHDRSQRMRIEQIDVHLDIQAIVRLIMLEGTSTG